MSIFDSPRSPAGLIITVMKPTLLSESGISATELDKIDFSDVRFFRGRGHAKSESSMIYELIKFLFYHSDEDVFGSRRPVGTVRANSPIEL